MDINREDGVLKYGVAWMLGVPVSLLVVIFLSRVPAEGCGREAFRLVSYATR